MLGCTQRYPTSVCASRCGNTAKERFVSYLVISLGGILGANARYLLGNWIAARYGTSFPYGTMVINVSGSFVIGFFLVLLTERFVVHPNWRRLFFAVGFLGAYTTFSTFVLVKEKRTQS
jgi:CrcB protein